jgi:translation initiation factor IF-2
VTGSLEALTERCASWRRRRQAVLRAAGRRRHHQERRSARGASNATIIGFNVRPDRTSRELALAEDVEIRTYEIIYQVLEDIENALLGLLQPEYEEWYG